eukprot:GHVS01056029.1.p1 GENE.GHVS01056029.1~~GHVS01056029.1.p1  ORF type:complete len:159 (-),score=8.53 GHVS01056029.1:45-521(-)
MPRDPGNTSRIPKYMPGGAGWFSGPWEPLLPERLGVSTSCQRDETLDEEADRDNLLESIDLRAEDESEAEQETDPKRLIRSASHNGRRHVTGRQQRRGDGSGHDRSDRSCGHGAQGGAAAYEANSQPDKHKTKPKAEELQNIDACIRRDCFSACPRCA